MAGRRMGGTGRAIKTMVMVMVTVTSRIYRCTIHLPGGKAVVPAGRDRDWYVREE